MHHAVTSFFDATGSSLEESCYRAFPASLVSPRMTSAEQLADFHRRNERDRRPAQAPLVGHTIESSGSQGHMQHAVRFRFADGTEQYFAPHTN